MVQAPAVPPPVPETAALPISFNNPAARRVVVPVAMLAVTAGSIPLLNLLFLVWWVMAGWFATYSYFRLTSVVLTRGNAARLGLLTGVLVFAGTALVFALEMAIGSKQFFELLAKQSPESAKIVQDPTMLATFLAFLLVFLFCIVTGSCILGGIIAAKTIAGRAKR